MTAQGYSFINRNLALIKHFEIRRSVLAIKIDSAGSDNVF